MASAQFCDNYSSTLASGYTSGGSSLSVTSAGSGASTLPASGDYYVIVQSEGANTTEVFKVTARSGTTLTVAGAQAGTSASNHASGATIIGTILTNAAVTQMKQDIATSMSVSAFDSDTTTGTLNPNGRSMVRLTDGPYACIWNGSAWEYYHADAKVKPPSLASLTLLNATSGSVTGTYSSSSKAGRLYTPAVSGENWRLATVGSIPGTSSYTLTVAFRVAGYSSNVPSAGMFVADSGSTPKFQFWGWSITGNVPIYAAYKMTSPTAFAGTSTLSSVLISWLTPVVWFRVSLASGTYSYQHSIDGINWITVGSASATAFLTSPAQWGICVNAGNTSAGTDMLCVHLESA